MAICTVYSFCSGFGMLESGIRVALEARGVECLVVGYCEREAGAASALVARMAQEAIGEAPVAGDMATFDGRLWRGRVDIVCAGLPCQPYSVAGKKRGNTDHRSLGNDDGPVAHFLRIIDEMQPAIIFLENVPPWITQGHFYSVGERLCELGYQIEDPIFLASQDVGANHKRERVFIMAHCQSARTWPVSARSRREGFGETDLDGSCQEMGNGDMRSGRGQCPNQTRSATLQPGPEVADSELADSFDAGHGERRARSDKTISKRGDTDDRSSSAKHRAQLAHAGEPGFQENERGGHFMNKNRPHVDQLPNSVALWATARTPTGGKESKESKMKRKSGGIDLQTQIFNFPDTHSEGTTGTTGQLLQVWTPPACPQLNPNFQWWLMGWPSPTMIFSGLAETAWTHWWRQLRSAYYLIESQRRETK